MYNKSVDIPNVSGMLVPFNFKCQIDLILLPLKLCGQKGIFPSVYICEDLFIPGGKLGLDISGVGGPVDVVKSDLNHFL